VPRNARRELEQAEALVGSATKTAVIN